MVTDALFSRPRSVAVALMAVMSLSGVGALVAGAGPASATTTVVPCATRVESTPFASWGDTHPYFLMPNGTFESGSASWSLTGGATVASGNESNFANSATDAHSLVLPAGGQATSATICVGRDETSFRLFVKNPGVKGAKLQVQVNVQNPTTGQVEHETFTVDAKSLGSGWSPTAILRIPKPAGGATGTQNLTLVFSPIESAATWSIDDVFIDPFRMR
jgi:hypothetical protein